jgi:hypothetical protein
MSHPYLTTYPTKCPREANIPDKETRELASQPTYFGKKFISDLVTFPDFPGCNGKLKT